MENCKGTVVNNNYCCCCCNEKGDTETGTITAQVGSIMYAHILQSGYVKANGDLLNRSDHSALYKYAKENNLILSETDWANDMQGMFAEGDGANTFRVPDLRGQFLRGVDDGVLIDIDRVLGSKQGDAIRNIYGEANSAASGFGTGPLPLGGGVSDTTNGVFKANQYEGTFLTPNGTISSWSTTFDASRVVPTAPENRVKNIALIAQIKY